jgi:hypothetical protein
MMRKSFSFLTSIFAVVLCLSISIIAQTTTGEISGTVKDANGAVVPGASVTISGTNVGYNRTVQADDSGVYRAQQVPPGSYKVTVAPISGFAAQTKNNVLVGINNLTTVDFSLGATTEIVVDVQGGDNIVDATETKAQTNISAREIDALPKGTGFTSLLRTAAAVRPEPLSGQFTINGATGPENSFIIDGQETQNFKTGLINSNNDIPYQALQEIQVKASGFEAEFGGATGGVINGVTKSGSNQFHGEFGVNLATAKLNAGPRVTYSIFTNSTNLPGETIPHSGQGIEFRPQSRVDGTNFYPTALLSGPIIKDKLWFFGIHSPRVVNEEASTTWISGFGPTRTLTTFSSTLNSLGATNPQTFRRKTTYNYSQLRLDAAPFNSVRINSSFTWNPIVQRGNILSTYVVGSPTTLVDNGTTYQGADAARFQGGRQNSNNFRLEGVYTPTSKLVLLGRYTRGFLNEKLGSYGIPAIPQFVCSQVPDALVATAGCAQGFVNISSNSNTLRDISIRTAYDAQASYLFKAFGSHELKGGYQNSKILNDVSSGNAGPGRTYLYYGQKCFDTSFVYVQWKINEGTYACPADSIGTGVTYQFGTVGKATNTAHTFFIQDKWQPTSRLTFNLGLRTEQEDIPAFNADAIDLKFKFMDKLAPRLGVAYALTGDGKTKISAFYGRFFDRLKFALPRGSFGGDFYHVSYFYIRSGAPAYTNYTVGSLAGSYGFPAGGQCPNPAGSQYVCDQDYRIASNSTSADVFETGQVDPNVKPYRQSEATVEFQREVMRSTVFTARYLWRNLDQVIEDIGIPTSAGEAYVIGNPGSGLAADVYQELGYNKIPKAVRTYKALQLELDSRFVKNFSLNLNYTLSRLHGNYSGLASPDEVSVATGTARTTTPNVNRDFDEPWVGFTASGDEAIGVLPLDRTHVFKASGTYMFDWWNSRANSTDVSFFTTLQSGTPLTTFVNIMGIPIPETKRGDLGRTEAFSQTDLNFTHRYKFGRDDRLTLAFDLNILNVFNENHVLAVNQNKHSGFFALSSSKINSCGTSIVCAVNYLTSNGVLTQYAAAETAFTQSATVFGVNAARNAAFLQPISYSDPRSVRFGFRLLF